MAERRRTIIAGWAGSVGGQDDVPDYRVFGGRAFLMHRRGTEPGLNPGRGAAGAEHTWGQVCGGWGSSGIRPGDVSSMTRKAAIGSGVF